MLLPILRRLSGCADGVLSGDDQEERQAKRQRTHESDFRGRRLVKGYITIEIRVHDNCKWPFSLGRFDVPCLVIRKRDTDGKAFFAVGPRKSVYVSDELFECVNDKTEVGEVVSWVFKEMTGDGTRITFELAGRRPNISPTAVFTRESMGGVGTTVHVVAFNNRVGWTARGLAGAVCNVSTMLTVTETLSDASGLTYEFETNGVKFIHEGELPGDAFAPSIGWYLSPEAGEDDVVVRITLNRSNASFLFERQLPVREEHGPSGAGRSRPSREI